MDINLRVDNPTRNEPRYIYIHLNTLSESEWNMGTAVLTSIFTSGLVSSLWNSNCRSFGTPVALARTLASSNVFSRWHKRVVWCSNNPTFTRELTALSDVSSSANTSSVNGYLRFLAFFDSVSWVCKFLLECICNWVLAFVAFLF